MEKEMQLLSVAKKWVPFSSSDFITSCIFMHITWRFSFFKKSCKGASTCNKSPPVFFSDSDLPNSGCPRTCCFCHNNPPSCYAWFCASWRSILVIWALSKLWCFYTLWFTNVRIYPFLLLVKFFQCPPGSFAKTVQVLCTPLVTGTASHGRRRVWRTGFPAGVRSQQEILHVCDLWAKYMQLSIPGLGITSGLLWQRWQGRVRNSRSLRVAWRSAYCVF